MLKHCVLLFCIQFTYELDNLQLLTKIRSSFLEKYEDFINSVIFHINIPPETMFASFQFQSDEIDLSIFGCHARNVSLFMKWGAPPVINPDGSKFPPTFYPMERSTVYHLEFSSNKQTNYINITAPKHGLYFVATFLQYTNPKYNAISQKGLSPHCMPFVDVEVHIKLEKSVEIVAFNQIVHVNRTHLYKFLARNVDGVLLTGNGLNVTVQIDKIPSSTDYLLQKLLQNVKTEETILIPTQTDRWHYMLTAPTFKLAEFHLTPSSGAKNNNQPYVVVDLIRKSNSESFTYTYELPRSENSRLITLNSSKIVVLKFHIDDISDVGGTLQYSLAVKMTFRHKIIGLLSQNTIQLPKWPLGPLILNRTHTNRTIHLPFPEIGVYYASFKLFCDDFQKNCTENVTFDLSSQPCLNGACSDRGRCVFLVSSGFVYSACSCADRYRGWTCSDSSQIVSDGAILLELLLLVLSNMAFIPCVYVAYTRAYYIEALCFMAICFFSTFYHACDAGEHLYSFCLTKLSALMFADFFCALLTFWIILLAMADMKSLVMQQFLQLSGAIVLSFCTMIDKMSLWIFFVPTLTGLAIICVCWYIKYRKNSNNLFINKRYYVFNLPFGAILLVIGLTIYATMQTEENYKYLHSMWHIIMAISAIILLPKHDTFLPNMN